MSRRLQSVMAELNRLERNIARDAALRGFDVRAVITVTVLYLCFMLSVPVLRLSDLLLFAVCPIVAASAFGVGFGGILRRSLIIVPFVALIGVFNPLVDRQPALFVGEVAVSRGWVSFVSVIVRGVLSVQAVLTLVCAVGFHSVCVNLRRMGLPAIFTTQLMLTYRYLFVILDEAQSMQDGRVARGFGRKNFPLKMWGVFVSQLLVRSVARAERVGWAMAARGFTGEIPSMEQHSWWHTRDTVLVVVCVVVFAVLRFVRPVYLFTSIFGV